MVLSMYMQLFLYTYSVVQDDTGGRAVEDEVLRPLDCWDHGFGYR
jgi:hypothetical protein